MKTPEQIAQETLANHSESVDPYGVWEESRGDALRVCVVAAIEADRSQLVGQLAAARHRIDLSHDAAYGDSNDSEIEILQDVRDCYQTIVEAVGGEWEHEPDADHLEQEEWPHVDY